QIELPQLTKDAESLIRHLRQEYKLSKSAEDQDNQNIRNFLEYEFKYH
ncbi:unnamed protein product, partial [marine sediment metagenome]